MDDSGTEVFTILFPSGTPLPARRHHSLQGPGSLSSVSLELYQAQRAIAQVTPLLRDISVKIYKEIRDNIRSAGNDCKINLDVVNLVLDHPEDVLLFLHFVFVI